MCVCVCVCVRVCVCVCVIIFISTCLLGFLGLYSLLVLCVPLLPLPTLTHHPLLSSPHTLLHAPTHTHMTSLPIRVIAFHIVSILFTLFSSTFHYLTIFLCLPVQYHFHLLFFIPVLHHVSLFAFSHHSTESSFTYFMTSILLISFIFEL